MKFGPKETKELNQFLKTGRNKKREFLGGDITFASDLTQPEPKREVVEIDLFNQFNLRNPRADGGRIPFQTAGQVKDFSSLKNIRLSEGGNFRFDSEAGGKFFTKTFPPDTDLKDVIKFRDDYLSGKGIEPGKLKKPPNPKRGKYVGVKDQKHIKFNGVTYQVQVQRMKDGKRVSEKPFYTTDLDEAIKVRDERVAKFPPKSFKDFNIKERPKKVNAEILQLSKNPTIKNIFKTGELTDEAITEAANILKVNKATAIDRLENLATAYTGDRKNVPGIKPAFIDNARKIAALLPGAKTKAAELATGVPFIGESIKTPKGQILRDAPYDTSLFDIDEARATATGLKRNTSPYSIFGQIIKRDINRGVKGGFSGSGWDSRSGTLEKNLDEAIQKFGANSKQAKAAKDQYNKEATLFENNINKNKRRGAKKITIPKISLDAPSKTISNYKNLNKTYKDVFNKNFEIKKYSFEIPKDLNPIPKIVEDFKDPKIRAKVERAMSLGDARVYANPIFSPGILKEAFKQLPTPAGAVALNLGLGVDPTSAIDRASIAAEAAFAPALVKQAAKLGSVGQRIANLGLTPAMAARAARIASPLGIASLGAEGLYQAGKFTKKRIDELRSMTPEQRTELRNQGARQAFDPFQAAGGGIAKQAGDSSGRPPEKGPNSQGLPGLLKRVRNL